MNIKKIPTLTSVFITEMVYGGHLLSIGASSIVLCVVLLLNLDFNIVIIIIPYLISQVVYSYNHFQEIEHDTDSNPERVQHINSQKKWLGILLILYFFLLFTFTILTNFTTLIAVSFIIVAGILYTDYLKEIMTRDLAGFKNLYTSFFWAFLIFIVPSFYNMNIDYFFLYFFFFVFIRWIINSAFFDIKDIDSDARRGLKTFAVILGKKKTIYILHLINFISFIPLLIGVNNNHLPIESLSLVFLILYSAYYLTHALFLTGKSLRTLSYIVVDGEYIFWPILVMIVMIIL